MDDGFGVSIKTQFARGMFTKSDETFNPIPLLWALASKLQDANSTLCRQFAEILDLRLKRVEI